MHSFFETRCILASFPSKFNKCIGDDTKAALAKPQTALRKQKKNKIWRKTIFNNGRMKFLGLHPAMWHVELES